MGTSNAKPNNNISHVLFFISFFVVTLLFALFLSKNDPEPVGASTSLFILGVGGAFLSSLIYLFTAIRLKRYPTNIAGLVSGSLCSLLFFSAINFINLNVGVTFLLLLVITMAAPFCSSNNGLTSRSSLFARFTRSRDAA